MAIKVTLMNGTTLAYCTADEAYVDDPSGWVTVCDLDGNLVARINATLVMTVDYRNCEGCTCDKTA